MKILINASSGKTITLEVEPTDPVGNVKLAIFGQIGAAPARQILVHQGNQMEDGRTLASYHIGDESMVELRMLTLFTFKRADGTETSIQLLPSETMETLGKLMEELSGIPVEKQCYSVSQEDDQPTASVDVEMDSVDPSEFEGELECGYDGDESSGEEEEKGKDAGVGYSWEKMNKLKVYMDANPNHNWKTLKKQFTWLKQCRDLKRIVELVKKGGSTRHKWSEVDKVVWIKFNKAREKNLPVHCVDLHGWAQEAAGALLMDVQVSKGGVEKFTRKHCVVSRKATVLFTRKKEQNSTMISASADAFRKQVRKEAADFFPELVFNTDQSGFEYELHSTRTMSFKGEKDTALMVDSMNNCTHSYTIQPMLDMTGRTRGKLYICLQERGGKMGELVEKTYFRAPNVEVTCSASGKLTTSHITWWADRVLGLEACMDCLLLMDSWSGQTNDDCFAKMEEDREVYCTRLTIPPGTTGTTQPLDVYYFRQWKLVVKRLYDFVKLNQVNVTLSVRDHIIKMQSLVHNQFTSNRFNPMGRYAWFKAGLIDEDPGQFENASSILFPQDLAYCSTENCSEKAVIRCSHCCAHLCFHHFFTDYHTHF